MNLLWFQVYGVWVRTKWHCAGDACDCNSARSLLCACGPECRPVNTATVEPWKHRYNSFVRHHRLLTCTGVARLHSHMTYIKTNVGASMHESLSCCMVLTIPIITTESLYQFVAFFTNDMWQYYLDCAWWFSCWSYLVIRIGHVFM